MSFAATADDFGFFAPLGTRETDPEAGAARRRGFARICSAVKGMAKAAFTKENAKNIAVGAGTMFVLKSSAAAIAAAYALPAAAATASVLGVGAAEAAGLSYYRERSAAKREGRAADGFFSDANLRRMSLAAGISVVGGSLVAAYQGGMFAPITDKLAELAKHLHLPEVHVNLSPISDVQAYDYSPGGRMDQMYGHGAAAVTPTPHPEVAAPAPSHVATPAPASAPETTSHHFVATAEKPAVPPVLHETQPATGQPESSHIGGKPEVWHDPKTGRIHAEYPAHPDASASDVAPVPTGGGSALDRVREMLEQQGGKPSRSMEMLLDRAAHSAQGEKDLAIALLWGKGGFTANPELARTLLEDAVKQGNAQAVTSLAWMDKHGLGLSSSSHAPAVTEAHSAAPAHPATPETPSGKGAHVSAKPAMDHTAAHPAPAAAPVSEPAPKTVVIAPDLPPEPVAPDGVAIACTLGGDAETSFTVDCTAPKGKGYVLPGEKMTAVWPGQYPGVKIEITNESGDMPTQVWRAATWAFYDHMLEVKGMFADAFNRAAEWRAQHSPAAEKIAKAMKKFADFAFNG